MWNLEKFGLADMVSAGSALRELGKSCASMECLGQSVCNHLFANLRDAGGEPGTALVRFFKTHAYQDLPPDLRESASAMLGARAPWNGLRCLTLLGTAGHLDEWKSRTSSRGHQAIPLVSRDFVRGAPMVAALAQQLGIDISDLVEPRPGLFVQQERATFNVFHVEDALGSPVVPAQDQFVIPHRVRSVLGLGGVLPSGEVFALIMFSKCAIPAKVVPLFKPLALNLRSAALQVSNKIFK